ncbi:hypothetical protein [Rhodococcus koreensis]
MGDSVIRDLCIVRENQRNRARPFDAHARGKRIQQKTLPVIVTPDADRRLGRLPFVCISKVPTMAGARDDDDDAGLLGRHGAGAVVHRHQWVTAVVTAPSVNT